MPSNQVNPNYQAFEEELKNHVLIRDKIQEKINKRKFSTPISINKEKHPATDNTEQAQKAKEYDNIASIFPDGKVPSDLKDQWTNLNNRPNITQEEYNNLKQQASQGGVSQKPEGLPDDWQDQLAELKQWKEKFKDKTPDQVSQELSTKPTNIPEGLPSDWKEQLDSIKGLKDKITELEKRPTPEELNQAVQKEKDKHTLSPSEQQVEILWEHVNNLTSIIKKEIPTSKPK